MLDVEPRLLACDVDGTLLDPDGHLRPRIWRAIDEIRERGVHVVLATGRSPWAMSEVCEILGLAGPQIAMQGGLIASPLTGEVTLARELDLADVAAHRAFAREIGVEAVIGTADGYRAERLPATRGTNNLGALMMREASRFHLVPSIVDEAAPRPIRTVLLTSAEQNADVREATRQRFGNRYSIVWSDDHAVELLVPGTHKGSALRFLAAAFGIPMQEVAAIGDGWNDLEMLRAAGVSAAMATAPEPVRSAAMIVVPPSADEGALAAFRHFLPRMRSTEPSWAPIHRWVTPVPAGMRPTEGPQPQPAAGRVPLVARGRRRVRVVEPRRRPGMSRA